jgi:PUA domain protein
MEIAQRHGIRKSDLKELKEELGKIIKDDVKKLFNTDVELVKTTEEIELYAENKNIVAFKYKDQILPSLKALNKELISLPAVTVDMGAVPYVTNGADIMFPGIVKVTEGLEKGDIVTIIDERHDKTLAIGELLVDGKDIKKNKKGKAIQNLHYVGDDIWHLEL